MVYEFILATFLFIIGCFFGSFFLVLIDRLPRGEKITGRSYCESCKKTLRWYDLIPVVSYASTGGRCRYCHIKLSYYYPFLEILTGVIFAGTILLMEARPFPEIVYIFIIVSLLLVLFFADLKYMLLPFPLILLLILATSIFVGMYRQDDLGMHLISGMGAFIFFLLIFLVTRGRGMGFGDVVYSFWMGFALSFPGILIGLYVSFLTGAIVSLILILLGLKKLRGDTIPFGPFLILGTILVLFWEDRLITIARLFLPI